MPRKESDRSARPKSDGQRTSGGRSGSSVKTPPKGTRRPAGRAGSADPDRGESSPAARDIIASRGLEFWGIGFCAIGVLLVLSLYVGLAGPVGRGIDTGLGWAVGLGRFALPPVTLGIGVAMVRRQSVDHRVRLTLGWAVLICAGLGVLHVVNGDRGIVSELDAMSRAGGWVGAVIAEPLRATISWAGALVVLIAFATGGVMLITDTTLPELAALVRSRVDAATASRNAAAPGTARATQGPRTTIYDGVDDDHGADTAPTNARATSVVGDPLAPPPLVAPAEASSIDASDETDDAADDAEDAAEETTFDAGPRNLPLGPAAMPSDWTLPPRDVLKRSESRQVDDADIDELGRVLQESLASHGVETRLVGRTVGPTVTRFELELGAGVKVAKVTSLNRDIAYAMAATDVRILAPIPGRSAIGVEVPNATRQLVSLGDLMASPESKAAVHPLEVAIGKDIAGRAVFLNLATTPHLLIAGATGAGKSSALNSVITSLLMRTTPDQVRMILIDPKQVEMNQYAHLPHLMIAPVTNPKGAANALNWAVKEMERRYDLLVEVGFRDIGGYNAAWDRGELNPPADDGAPVEQKYERMRYIVVIVDELNDLMMVAARDVEECITRIAQKARAVGIHLIVATQRPSVNVITGVIKANIPARMAFAVSSLTDSRVILDQPGAEKLVGQGDMLLLPGNSNVAQRIQGSWVGEDEVRKVVAHWRKQAPSVVYVSGIDTEGTGPGGAGSPGSTAGEGDDELFVQAREIVVRSGIGSTSLLQRKLKVGFARAGRLMDLLEDHGVVGPSEGSKARTVLMSVEELDQITGQ